MSTTPTVETAEEKAARLELELEEMRAEVARRQQAHQTSSGNGNGGNATNEARANAQASVEAQKVPALAASNKGLKLISGVLLLVLIVVGVFVFLKNNDTKATETESELVLASRSEANKAKAEADAKIAEAKAEADRKIAEMEERIRQEMAENAAKQIIPPTPVSTPSVATTQKVEQLSAERTAELLFLGKPGQGFKEPGHSGGPIVFSLSGADIPGFGQVYLPNVNEKRSVSGYDGEKIPAPQMRCPLPEGVTSLGWVQTPIADPAKAGHFLFGLVPN